MHVLITGGAGFIGSHTAHALITAGHQVRVLDCLDPQIHGNEPGFPDFLHPDIECIRGDVRDPEAVAGALQGIDAVYHFAALTGVGQSMYDLRHYTDVSVTGTANLLECIVKQKTNLKRLILASSRATYGEGTARCSEHGLQYPDLRKREDLEAGRFDLYCPHCGRVMEAVPTAEDRPLKPTSVYAWTKQQQENLCQYAAQDFGVPVSVLRYFNVYGPHQSLNNPYTGVVAIFFSRIRSGNPVSIYEHNKPIRDMVYVGDVVQANLRALEADINPRSAINVGAGTRHTIEDVAHAVADALGVEPDLRDSGEFRVGDILQCYADLERANNLLGYHPSKSLMQGMSAFVDWASTQEANDEYQRTVDELTAFGLFGKARS